MQKIFLNRLLKMQLILIIWNKNSELNELWSENEKLYPKWKNNLEELINRLK